MIKMISRIAAGIVVAGVLTVPLAHAGSKEIEQPKSASKKKGMSCIQSNKTNEFKCYGLFDNDMRVDEIYANGWRVVGAMSAAIESNTYGGGTIRQGQIFIEEQ